jgi:hypothetical protein
MPFGEVLSIFAVKLFVIHQWFSRVTVKVVKMGIEHFKFQSLVKNNGVTSKREKLVVVRFCCRMGEWQKRELLCRRQDCQNIQPPSPSRFASSPSGTWSRQERREIERGIRTSSMYILKNTRR